MAEELSNIEPSQLPATAETEPAAGAAFSRSPKPGKDNIVELKNVCKRFADGRTGKSFEILKDFNFAIEKEEEGAFVVLLGPSGCGKSTILSLISGLALPDSGEVQTFGKPITGPSPYSATVPQAYTCFPWCTVQKNVEFGLALNGKAKPERYRIAQEYLHKVGLGDRGDSYPKQLSGGMQQRVAIARTLATKPDIVLMDEPFGALDAQTRAEMQQMLLKLWNEERNTIIFVTHDIVEALLLGDRVIVFSRAPATIIHEELDLDGAFGHDRPASLTSEKHFTDLCEKLRAKLKRPVAVH